MDLNLLIAIVALLVACVSASVDLTTLKSHSLPRFIWSFSGIICVIFLIFKLNSQDPNCDFWKICPIPTPTPTNSSKPSPIPSDDITLDEKQPKTLFNKAYAAKAQIAGKIEKAKINDDLEEIKDAKELVEHHINSLKSIPSNSSVAQESNNLLNEYKEILKSLDLQIKIGCVVGNLGTCIH